MLLMLLLRLLLLPLLLLIKMAALTIQGGTVVGKTGRVDVSKLLVGKEFQVENYW
jgi:hypothetical protein